MIFATPTSAELDRVQNMENRSGAQHFTREEVSGRQEENSVAKIKRLALERDRERERLIQEAREEYRVARYDMWRDEMRRPAKRGGRGSKP